ncbi:hypothetical protein HNY73_002963 [Argiope bruennichi]|uniref:Uncharacterized protein n=1 Tax=Argiope bruennichi TaxID=94029 RepID=A0A8T0FVF0_ARGBR|nr:hypothetical protein HNY73_002963 [Argiope bruennichi]
MNYFGVTSVQKNNVDNSRENQPYVRGVVSLASTADGTVRLPSTVVRDSSLGGRRNRNGRTKLENRISLFLDQLFHWLAHSLIEGSHANDGDCVTRLQPFCFSVCVSSIVLWTNENGCVGQSLWWCPTVAPR